MQAARQANDGMVRHLPTAIVVIHVMVLVSRLAVLWYIIRQMVAAGTIGWLGTPTFCIQV